MNRLGAGRLRGSDDLLADQITLTRRRRPDMHGLIGLAHMQRLGVGVRIDRDGPDTHLARGADDAAGDFAAVGDEEGVDHARSSPERGGGPSAGWWRGTGGLPCRSLIFIARSLHTSTIRITAVSKLVMIAVAGTRRVAMCCDFRKFERAASCCVACSPSCVRPSTSIARSEEHTSELQSLMRISYAVF